MSFIARQPNGLLCRYSGIVETITNYNMTEEDYIELCKKNAEETARKTIKFHCETFDFLSCEFFRFDSGCGQEETEQIFEAMGETPENAVKRRKYWKDIGVYD